MVKHMFCWLKSKITNCYLYRISVNDTIVQIANLCLDDLSKLQNKLDKCTEKNSIDKVSNFKGEYINEKYWDDFRNKEIDKKNLLVNILR